MPATPEERLLRIAQAHYKFGYTAALTQGYCHECGWTFPCPTWRWASQDHEVSEPWFTGTDSGPWVE